MIERHGRILGVDYGTVRLGLAISDADQQFSSPYENYQRSSVEADAKFLKNVVEQESVIGIVVGLPIHLDGRESAKSQEARAFGAWLAEITDRSIVYYDERLTSKEAESQLRAAKLSPRKRKQRLDMLAAQLLLAAFLESDRETLGGDQLGLAD